MPHDLQELLDGLASADPAIRDGWAYTELAEGIQNGRFDAERATIREAALRHLGSSQTQARAFAPLMLAWLVSAGDRDRPAFEAVAQWYPTEPDTRGYDEELGWLHTVAHGADYLGAAARVGIATGSELLHLLAARMLGPGTAWRDQEDARVAHAAMLALTGCGAQDAMAWLDPIADAVAEYEKRVGHSPDRGRRPAWLHNVYATCTTLYVALAEQPRDRANDLDIREGPIVRSTLASIVSRMTPWLLNARS